MNPFKVGDHVRLKNAASLSQAYGSRREYVKGEIVEVTKEGYTVILYDETLISKKGLTDDDIELDD
jgi:ribosomal protein L21E